MAEGVLLLQHDAHCVIPPGRCTLGNLAGLLAFLSFASALLPSLEPALQCGQPDA